MKIRLQTTTATEQAAARDFEENLPQSQRDEIRRSIHRGIAELEPGRKKQQKASTPPE